MNFKKILYLGMTVLTIGALTACGGDEEVVTEQVKTEATETVKEEIKEEVKNEVVAEPVKEEEEEVRDLGGLVVTIASWGDRLEPDEKKSAQEEALWEHRNAMMEKHNFKFEELALARWQDLIELMSTSTLSGEPAAEIFRIHATRVLSAVNSGLCYPLNDVESIDPMDGTKWSVPLAEVMTVDGTMYGIGESSRPKQMIFFNKRLFEEAGLEPDLLYDLQASGEWTWDKFMELSEILTQDKDNDGVNDTYAVIMNPASFAEAAVFANDGAYVRVDENGNYYSDLESPETVAALEWTAAYWQTDYDLVPEHWDGHKDLFYAGQAAMYMGDEWESTTFTQELMADDWGLVCFPKGPNADGYQAVYKDPGWVIPNTYTKEEVEDILFALDLWYGDVPGYDGPDDWKAELYPLYRDERAINETIAMVRAPEYASPDYSVAISSNVNIGLVSSDVYWNKATVTESIEAQKGIWQAELDKMNAK
ncbi:hypothetical protein AN641_08375 [Candidatus Epulonipiscioides gigas]|nr:hypothetical protein AN641_08375 [Epulopiscium sp. SCG-C07WGA-EpuloA2]